MKRLTRFRGAGRRGWAIEALAVALAALTVSGAGPAAAQDACDEEAGTLGVWGLKCEGCSYSMSESGIEEARFRTEPQVLAVARGFTEGDRLRAGDRIVAIDGALITTREGSDRLVDLRAGQRLTIRVRRDGRVEDLELTAGSACALRRQASEREVEVERMDGMGLSGNLPLPPVPRSPAPAPPTAPLPELPEPPALPPSGYLGFGIQCDQCGIRDGSFFFSAPPTITGIAPAGPAARAGLEAGDVLLEIDGSDITGAGAERFSEIEPGQSVRITVRRGTARRTVTLTAEERVRTRARTTPLPPLPAAAPTPFGDRLQFEGRLGDTRVEVRGGPVTVTRNEETGELVIRVMGTTVRLSRQGGS